MQKIYISEYLVFYSNTWKDQNNKQFIYLSFKEISSNSENIEILD